MLIDPGLSDQLRHPRDKWGFPLRGSAAVRPPAKQTTGVSHRAGQSTPLLDNLRRLCLRPRHGIPLSAGKIALEVGCSKKHIFNIQRRALRKMRDRLPKEVRAEFDELIARDRTAAIPKKLHAGKY